MKIALPTTLHATLTLALCFAFLLSVVGCEGRNKIAYNVDKELPIEQVSINMSLHVIRTYSDRIDFQLIIHNWDRDKLYLYDIDECGVYHHTLHDTQDIMLLEEIGGASTEFSLRSLKNSTSYIVTPFVRRGDSPSDIALGNEQTVSTTYY